MELAQQLQQDPKTGRFVPGNCLASKNAYYHDPEVLQAAIDDYFRVCEEKDQSPVVTGLALHLGFTGRVSLFDYLNRPGRSPFANIIKRAKAKIEAQRVQRMVDGKGNVVGAIFDLKNNFGYIDKQVRESDVKVQQTFTPEDRDALKALALQMIEARESESVELIDAECSEFVAIPEMADGVGIPDIERDDS